MSSNVSSQVMPDFNHRLSAQDVELLVQVLVPLIQSALQHAILRFGAQLCTEMTWSQALCAPCRKEMFKRAELTPTAPFE